MAPPRKPSNAYWKLEEHCPYSSKIALHKRARALGCTGQAKDWTVHSLSGWLRRRELQLLDYDRCSSKELATFIRDRQIPIFPVTAHEHANEANTQWPIRRRAIKALEDADHALSFHRFLDLPSELRNLVYELHFQDFPHALEVPAKPPIARTSQFVQRESLPLLYSNHEIILPFKMVENRTRGDRWDYERSSVPRVSNHYSIKCVIETAHTALFLQYMRPEHFQYLRNITLRTGTENDMDVEDEDELQEVIIRITLGKAAGSYRVKVEDHDPDFADDAEWTGQYESILKAEVEAVLDSVAARGGILRLTANDIHSMRPAIVRAYKRFDDWIGSKYGPQ